MDPEWKTLPRVCIEVDPDLIELIPDFLTRKQIDLQTLNEALANSDLAAIAALGHRIKGEGGSFGFDVVSEIGAALEAAGKNGDSESARHLVADLSAYLEKVEIVEGAET